ncbi:MAG: hypothetical protein H6513_06370 [Acidimicrobiaceae bacterium]|nr:hypothetical protein [Acidimicrobiaceae bacterium]
MKRTWITGLTIVGIAGTGGAAFAGMSNDAPLPPPFSGDTSQATGSTEAMPPEHTTYQVGPVGTVTVERDGDVLKIEGVTISDGWSLVATSVPGSHVGAQFTDALQLVTFSADLVDGQVVVNVTNQAAQGDHHRSAAADQRGHGAGPARPGHPAARFGHPAVQRAPAAGGPPATPPATQPSATPPPSNTTAPSAHDDDDDEHEHEHEDDDDHGGEYDDD